MHKIIYLFLLFSIYSNAQVIPIGTVIKGKRLPTLFSENVPYEDNSSATLYGSIKINDSKLSIVENGFVILLNSDAQSPNISYGRKVMVSGGTANFQTTLNDFASNTTYKYRAYAKNSKGEYVDNGKQRFRIHARPKYPTRTFSTGSVYLTNYKLPANSYWGLRDEHTEEMLVDFNTDFTKISTDNNGSYFDVYMEGLQPERYYRILVKSTLDGSTTVVDNGNVFKIVRNG